MTKSVKYVSLVGAPSLAANTYCNQHPPTSNFRSLAEMWEKRHECLQASSCDGVGEQRLPRRRPCEACHRCVCRGDGRILQAMALRCLRWMRLKFADGVERKKLIDGNIVVRFSGRTPARERVAEPSRSAAAPDPAPQDDVEDVYAHVSLMYLRPFRPTWSLLSRVANTALKPQQQDGTIALRTHYELVDGLSPRKAWTAAVLDVDEADVVERLVLEVCALHVTGRDSEPETIWEGWQEPEQAEAAEVADHFWLDEQDLAEEEGDRIEARDGHEEEDADMPFMAAQASSSSSSSRSFLTASCNMSAVTRHLILRAVHPECVSVSSACATGVAKTLVLSWVFVMSKASHQFVTLVCVVCS